MFNVPLPNEITCQIMTEAIIARDIRRAQRLRFVNKTWKTWADEAQVRLGHFFDSGKMFQCAPFYPQYLAHLALTAKPDDISPTLRAIRRAAEQVAGYGDPRRADSEAAVREYIIEICAMGELWADYRLDDSHWRIYVGDDNEWQYLQGVPREMPGDWWPRLIEKAFPFSEHDRYEQALLAIAASINQVSLIKETLQSMQGVPGGREAIVNFALGVAAYKGYDATVSLLLDAYSGSNREIVSTYVTLYASKANNLSTLELVLGIDRVGYSLSNAMAETTSLEIYQRLFSLALDELHEDNYLDTIGDHMLLMARRGALPILQYLLQLEIPAAAYWTKPPADPSNRFLTDQAIRRGHTETVRWLVGNGYDKMGYENSEKGLDRDNALKYAAQRGDPALMQLFLRHYGGEGVGDEVLLRALRRENAEVARILLRTEPYSRHCTPGGLISNIREMGLESMEKLLREHQADSVSTT
ncbi:hypothetical protein PG996_011744 [Apiospora saccharicola]|uniref:F-box domain-containing protein n=1 Tax=Apiospora saccharicola TaxID=335842 RepID=A0ABR1UFX2_9PEZI